MSRRILLMSLLPFFWSVFGRRKKNSSNREKSSEIRRNPSSSVVRITLIMRRSARKSVVLTVKFHLICQKHGAGVGLAHFLLITPARH